MFVIFNTYTPYRIFVSQTEG